MTTRPLQLSAALVLFASSVLQADEKDLPLGLSRLDFDEGPPAAAVVELGEKLFFDKRLSIDGSVSCASCHVPEQAFAQRGEATSKGVGNRIGRRNSPSLLNVTFAKELFLDGRSGSLEAQAWLPILDPDEMGNQSVEQVLQRLAATEDYPAALEKAFGKDQPDKESIAIALATYQRTLFSGNSKFDQWYWGGESKAMNKLEVEGYNLFSGQALCWQCHNIGGDHGVIFTDQMYHNTGVEWLSQQRLAKKLAKGDAGTREESKNDLKPESKSKPDRGRAEASGESRHQFQFKTPSLRNVALTAPYMHDGSFASLEEVVAFYNRGGGDGQTQALQLSDRELKSIVAFLKCLTGDQKYRSPRAEKKAAASASTTSASAKNSKG